MSRQRVKSNRAVAAIALFSAIAPVRAAAPLTTSSAAPGSLNYLLTGSALITVSKLGRRKRSGNR